MANIPIFNTFINTNAAEKVSKLLASTFISEGAAVKEFESRLSSEIGISYPVAVNSGTTALHLALVLAGVTQGDEVIIPAQTFVATGLVVLQQGAVPVFADINYLTGNIDTDSFEEKITSKTKAVIPVHWGGYPCDMDEINALAKKHNIAVIEDAAHALGAVYKEKKIGTLSDFTCFSFQAIKHLTTGDGGAISFLEIKNSDTAVIKRWFGIDRKNAAAHILGERNYNISSLGFKYHLNDYAASLGLANLEGFAERLAQRRKIAALYNFYLKDVPGINSFEYKNDRESAYWLYGFHVSEREKFILALKDKGIAASVVHQRIDRNTVFGGLKQDLHEQKRFDATQIHIPIHDAVTEEQAFYIINTIKAGW